MNSMSCLDKVTTISWGLTVISAIATFFSCVFAWKMRNYYDKISALHDIDMINSCKAFLIDAENCCYDVLHALNPVNCPRGKNQQKIVAEKTSRLNKLLSSVRHSIPSGANDKVEIYKANNQIAFSDLDALDAGSLQRKKPSNVVSSVKKILIQTFQDVDAYGKSRKEKLSN